MERLMLLVIIMELFIDLELSILLDGARLLEQILEPPETGGCCWFELEGVEEGVVGRRHFGVYYYLVRL